MGAGEKLEVVKKQLKVQKKQEKIAVDPSKVGKKKLKGIRIKKGVRVEVWLAFTLCQSVLHLHLCHIFASAHG